MLEINQEIYFITHFFLSKNNWWHKLEEFFLVIHI